MSNWRWVQHHGERKLIRLQEFWSDAARAAALEARRLHAGASLGEVQNAVKSLKRGESLHIEGSDTHVERKKIGGYAVHQVSPFWGRGDTMAHKDAAAAAANAHSLHTTRMEQKAESDRRDRADIARDAKYAAAGMRVPRSGSLPY